MTVTGTAAARRPPVLPFGMPPPPTAGAVLVAHQRLVHLQVGRALALLAWGAATASRAHAEAAAVAQLCGVSRRRHALERDLVWPVVLGRVPAAARDTVRLQISTWLDATAAVDRELDQVAAAARRWQRTQQESDRDAFVVLARRAARSVSRVRHSMRELLDDHLVLADLETAPVPSPT